MTKQADQIADLQRQIDELKSAQPTPMPTEEDVARHRDEMRRMEDERFLRGALSFYSPDQLRAMREACPDPHLRRFQPLYDLTEEGINRLRRDRMTLDRDEHAELWKIVSEGRNNKKPKAFRRF